MIATFYLIISAMCFVALYYSFKLWRQHPNPITLLILIPLLFLWLDNFAIATGKWVGEGPILTGMTYLRFYWHWQMLPLYMIVAGALARRSGFFWAQPKWVMAIFCIVAVFFMIDDVPYIWQVQFQPACYGDTYRFVINVPAGQLCEGTTALDKFPWLALPCVFMFACAASGAIPGFYWGQLIGNVGEPIFNIGLIAAGFKYAGLPKPAAASVAAPA